MARNLQPLLWLGFAASLVAFYVSFITAETYYNPLVTQLIIVLAVVIAVTGTLLSRLPPEKRLPAIRNRFVLRTISLYRYFFLLAELAILGDVLSTIYAVVMFGSSVEANRAVVGLIQMGGFLAWLGQEFTPLLVAGAIFGLMKNIYVRALMAFFTIGTLGYAIATVVNNLVVIYQLSGTL